MSYQINIGALKSMGAFIAFMVIVAISLSLPLWAADARTATNESIEFRDPFQSQRIDQSVSYYEDKTGNLTFKELLALSETKNPFRPLTKKALNFGFTRSAYWIFFKYTYSPSKNLRETKMLLLEVGYPLIDYVQCYLRDDSTVVKKEAGAMIAYNDREMPYRNAVIKLPSEPYRTHAVYLRIKTEGSMNIPLVVWETRAFIQSAMNEQYVFGLYFGLLLVMAFLNLFIFITIRSRDNLIYVLYIISVAFFQLSLNGLTGPFFTKESIWAQLISVPISGSFLAIFMNIFGRLFLQSHKNAPYFNKALLFLIVLFICNVPAAWILKYRTSIQIISFLSIVGAFILLFTAIRCFMTGYRPARLYLIAWIGIIGGFIILPMKNFGLLPHNLFTNYSILIGSAFEIIFMSLALADRMRIMQREKEAVQREAFERQKEMTESFSRFVPEEFLRYLNRENIVDIRLGDQSIREMTVLFSDIRSFTNISERLSPQENIDFLNSYLQKIAPIIRSNNGFIDKYIGDAIMALFPESVNDAINAAIQMHRALRELNECYNVCGETGISIGVGIHTGTLVLGTIGEENRIDTTVISDAVNTASRLESMNKNFNTKILVSKESFDQAIDKEKYPHRVIGLVKIRGKAKPIRVIEILLEVIE